MPTQSVDPGIDEEREHEAVECAAHHDAGEERQGHRFEIAWLPGFLEP